MYENDQVSLSDHISLLLWFSHARCTKCLFFIYFIVTQKKKIISEK